jgi:hypothetical protein
MTTDSHSESENKAIQVAASVEKFRVSLLQPTEENLSALCHSGLTYGHSNGSVETFSEFKDVLLSKKNVYRTCQISDQKVTVENDTAWVRHTLQARISIGENDVDVRLAILTVWIKINHAWKLFARQAVKL